MVLLTMTRVLLLAALMALVLAGPAEAYVDPGAGSMLMQLLLGGVMAGLVLLRSSWERVRGWFQRRPAAPPDKVA
jgi:hypothetical protein